VKALAAAGLNSVQVSVEGTSAAIHDRITRVKGSFHRSLEAVRSFRNAGLFVHINTTLNRLNREDAIRMPRLARRIGLERFSMNMMIPAGSGALQPDLPLSYAEVATLVQRIQSAARRERVEFMWYSPTPLCMFNTIARGLGNKGCAACDGLLSVAPDGNVLPCSSYDEPVGNILTEGFHRVWQGERARYFRGKQFAPAVCQECESFSACQGGCPLYWRARGFAELPAFQQGVAP
jgi:radical SAM protein with 4Fe4S-binding SPASM domain